MTPAMTNEEVVLLKELLSSSRNYLEFGCGGSTVLASELVRGSVTTVDSSLDWIDRVKAACSGISPDAFLVDIGPLEEWGRPRDDSRLLHWHEYHDSIWSKKPKLIEVVDTYLIDGRFRVACFMQSLLRSQADALYVIHDFDRPIYQVVLEFVCRIAEVGTLSAFRRNNKLDQTRARMCLDEHWRDPR